MTAFSNTRRNPFEGSISYRPMDPETHTVQEFNEFPGIYGIQVQDRLKPAASTVTDLGTGGSTFDQITTGNPLPGQCRIDNDTGYIFFNIADNGFIVEVDYQGGGSVASLENTRALVSGLAWGYGAALDANANSSQDLERAGGVTTNMSPFVLPVSVELKFITAASNTIGLNWTADVLKNDVSVATLTVQDKAFSPELAHIFNAGDTLRLRFTKIADNINRPSVNVYLKEIV